MSNSLSNFTSSYSSVLVKDLRSDLIGDVLWRFFSQKLVVKWISSSVYFYIIQVVRVDCRKTNSAIVHLSCEDFITVEVVTEDTSVWVSIIERVSSSDINKISKKGMHGVVLFLDIIQVFSIFVNSIRAKNVLKQKERVIIWIFDWRGIIENSNIAVNHFIISYEHKGRNVDRSLLILNFVWGLFWKISEMLIDLVNEFIMINVTSSNYNDVISEIVSGVEVSDYISWDTL